MANRLLEVTSDNVWSFICWSADDLDPKMLIETLELMKAAGIDISQLTVKIDRAMIEEHGWKILKRIVATGVRVFLDGKYIEIPTKLAKLARLIRLRRTKLPYMVNCMAGGVSTGIWESEDPDEIDGLKRFADALKSLGIKACAVTVLTTKSDKVVAREFNGRTREQQVIVYAEMLLAAGFTDLVCSPKEAAAIRADSRFDGLRLWCPGIRPVGADVQDQVNADSPEGALAAGVDVLVIGRPISNGEKGSSNFNNPVANLLEIGTNLVKAADKARAEAA